MINRQSLLDSCLSFPKNASLQDANKLYILALFFARQNTDGDLNILNQVVTTLKAAQFEESDQVEVQSLVQQVENMLGY